MSIFLYVSFSILMLLAIAITYRIGFIKGYRKGARRILGEWKDVMKTGEDD